MEAAATVLERLGVSHDVTVASARTPDAVAEYSRTARDRGVRVIIAGAGMSAALPGMVAAHTTLPVIGVPIDSSPLSGLDSLLSIAQMPPGVPVATVAIGTAGAKNAAILAAEILGVGDETVARALECLKADLADGRRI